MPSKTKQRCWSGSCAALSDFEEIRHIQGWRRSPSKMVGEAESHLESNPIPTSNAQRAQKYLCSLGPRDPPETETELCLGVSWGGTGQQWPATGAGALGAADLGVALALLEEVAINPTIEPPELTQDWETDFWRAQTESYMHPDQGEGSSDPIRDWPRLARQGPGVSGGCESVEACCRAGGPECSSVCMGPFEGGQHYLH